MAPAHGKPDVFGLEAPDSRLKVIKTQGITMLPFLLTLIVTQTVADFSGRWTTDPDPAPAPPAGAAAATPGRGRGPARGEMGSGWGSTITITQNDKQLIVEYVFFGRGDLQPPLKFVYALDGSETKNSVWMGRGEQVQTSRAAWDGGRLKITTHHTFTDPTTNKPATTDVVTLLSLESPASLVVETVRPGVSGGPPSSTKTVYRRLMAQGSGLGT